MSRKYLALTAVPFLLTALAACAGTPATAERPPLEACDATAAQFAVGDSYSDDLAERARVAAGAKIARGLFPGQAVTMEYRGDRLNLRVDEQGRVTDVNCG